MRKIDFQKVVELLSFVLKCPVCNYRYNLEGTKIIEATEEDIQDEASLLVHSDCQQCKSSVVFSIAISGPQIMSVGVITDLTSTDTAKFAKKEPISPDEVIGMHNFLRKFNGDLVKALQ
jgi:hypothetical protein